MTKRYFLLAVGWLSIALGVVGIFLPLLPTTPFLLLSAWCFANSSERAHQWLVNHRYLGPIVIAWQEGKGLPDKVCYRAIAVTWTGLFISMWIVAKGWSFLMLSICGTSVTIYLLKQRIRE